MNNMVTKNIPINSNILVWARKEANLSKKTAAAKAGIKDLKARGDSDPITSELRLERWEEGIETPTLKQLMQLAKAYRRPILTFFLPKPPIKTTQITDFRTVANRAVDSDLLSSEFSALLRRIEALQLELSDLVRDSNEEQLHFVGSANSNSSVNDIVQRIRETLDYTLDAQIQSHQVFNDVRTKAEEQRIFILLEGNLGSYHTNINPDIFRGVSISDKYAPLIVINPNDSKSARLFTLIHELCHIWIGDKAISNWSSLNYKTETEHENELFCDKVAAEFLVPSRNLVEELEKAQHDDINNTIERISNIFSVSKIVVARRILDFGYIDNDTYWNYYNEYMDEWDRIKKLNRQRENVISYKIRTRNRLGRKIIDVVLNASKEGRISELDAARMLNVKIKHFPEIL